MYDPLAAYYLLNPRAYVLKKMDVQVETKGEFTFGMSVADRRTWGEKNVNIEVAINVDRNAFVADFLRIIGSN